MKAMALTVPPDGFINVDGGLLDLACCDLIIEGTVTVTTGRIIARNLIIRPTGRLELGTGTVEVFGDITNQGVFLDSEGTVILRDQQPQPIPTLDAWALLLLSGLMGLLGIARTLPRSIRDRVRLIGRQFFSIKPIKTGNA